ncbi:MAG: radical SAM protein [Candidatus Methanomethylicaceae archaeon]
MRYKASKYNYNVPLSEDEYIWMNGVSGGAFKANREVHARIQAILADPNNCDTEQDRSLRDQLISLGFLIEENFDEVGFLKLKNRIARYGNEGLGLGVMLTLNCNFACPYCYQWRENKWMSPETKQALVNYVRKTMVFKRKLVIEWFGGEPLLDISGIRELSEHFLRICEEHKAHYQAAITTNGYLLTEQTACELAQLGISSVQVTIDGPPDIHNKRRILRDGRPTFDVILRNLEGAIKFFPSVAVRVNLDKTNSDRFLELLPYLAPLKERLLIGIAPVVPTRAAQRYKEFCFLRCDYLQIQCRLEQLLKDEGFIPLSGPTADRWWKTPKAVFCGAYQVDSYMIDPEGHLYKCTALAGEVSTKVGTLMPSGEIVYDWNRLLPWLVWEPFEDQQMCFTCPVLPLCLGGCHADRLYPGYQGGREVLPCSEVRENLAHWMRLQFATTTTNRVTD